MVPQRRFRFPDPSSTPQWGIAFGGGGGGSKMQNFHPPPFLDPKIMKFFFFGMLVGGQFWRRCIPCSFVPF